MRSNGYSDERSACFGANATRIHRAVLTELFAWEPWRSIAGQPPRNAASMPATSILFMVSIA